MSKAIRIIGERDGKPVYRGAPVTEEIREKIPFWRKLMGEHTFTGMSGAFVALFALRALAHVTLPTGLLGVAFTIATTIAGGAIGGIFNVHKFDKELSEGKVVEPPTMFNIEALHGALSGFSLGAAGIGGLIALAANFLTGATGAAAMTAVSGSILPIALVAGAALAAYNTFSYAKKGYERMEREYQTAEIKYAVQEGRISPAQARARAVSLGLIEEEKQAEVGVAQPGQDRSKKDIPEPSKPTLSDYGAAIGTLLGDESSNQQLAEKSMQWRERVGRAQLHQGSFADRVEQSRSAAALAGHDGVA